MPLSRTREFSWIAGIWLLFTLAFARFQPITTIGNGLGYDGHHYYAMAGQVLDGRRVEGAAPFVYRVGTPVLVAVVAKVTAWSLIPVFQIVNTIVNLISVLLLFTWLRRHVADASVCAIVVTFFMVEPHSPVRFAYFYPVNADPAALMFVILGLHGLDWIRDRPGWSCALVLALLVSVGVVFREIVLVIGVASLVAPRASWADRVRGGCWLPLLAGITIFTGIHYWVAVTPSTYTTIGAIEMWLRDKTLAQYLLAWLLVFGPLLILPVRFAAATARALVARPDWAACLAIVAVLAWVFGSDTERLLVFASPIVCVLVANALVVSNVAPASAAMAGLVVLQLLSSRIAVPIGGVTAPSIVIEKWSALAELIQWSSTYESLWSLMLTRRAIIFCLVWYLATMSGVMLCLWFAPRRRQLRTMAPTMYH